MSEESDVAVDITKSVSGSPASVEVHLTGVAFMATSSFEAMVFISLFAYVLRFVITSNAEERRPLEKHSLFVQCCTSLRSFEEGEVIWMVELFRQLDNTGVGDIESSLFVMV